MFFLCVTCFYNAFSIPNTKKRGVSSRVELTPLYIYRTIVACGLLQPADFIACDDIL